MTPLDLPIAAPRQSHVFMALYALAMAGAAISYYPFLTLILPPRVSQLAMQQDVAILGYISFIGAIAASGSGILFGWLSDRSGHRRAWVGAGLILSVLLLLLIAKPQSLWGLTALIIAWQMATNLMIAPLSAWAGDAVPDRQKGLLGGLLAFSPALGAASGALITAEGWVSLAWRLEAIGLLVILCVAPLLIWGRARAMPELTAPRIDGPRLDGRALRMWTARLLIQIAAATLFVYLYFWFRSVDPAMSDYQKAAIFSATFVIAVPAALLIGRWVDRREQPFKPLAALALGCAAGLIWMSASQDISSAKASFMLFAICSNIFLALHSAQLLRVLPKPQTRGRDIGIFNLTNTIPSMIMPWLTISVVPAFGFGGLFLILSGFSVIAAVLMATISSEKHA